MFLFDKGKKVPIKSEFDIRTRSERVEPNPISLGPQNHSSLDQRIIVPLQWEIILGKSRVVVYIYR